MLEVAEARAQVTTSLSDSDLTDVITREEAWLARRIGPLAGSRTETFITPDGDEVLRLQRPPQSGTVVAVDEGGAVADLDTRGWAEVVRTAGSWQGTVDITYTADDADEVKRALVTLVRLNVSESGYQSESWQGYSASQDHAMRRRMRWEAWRELLRPGAPFTTRLRSAIPAGGNTIGSVQVTAEGS